MVACPTSTGSIPGRLDIDRNPERASELAALMVQIQGKEPTREEMETARLHPKITAHDEGPLSPALR